MKKFIWVPLLLLFLIPADLLAACISPISLNTNVSSSWEVSCASEHRTNTYAKYFTFTLASSQEITVDLGSEEDTYLYLLAGSGTTGSIIAQDDDGGFGTNSQIVRTLPAGSYTVEATTFDPATTGQFVVSVNIDALPPSACIEEIAPNTDVPDIWEDGCTSAHRSGSYAKYFTFTLSNSREVTIDLESSQDTYLFLLNGAGQTGSIITEDDDGGNGTNARIVRNLAAGTYTVEATTYEPATTGQFVVSVSLGACTNCPFVINAGLNDAWFSPATSGQGMTVTVFPEIKQVFVTWFTFDTERPPANVTAMLGEPGHRWLTAQGPYDGSKAILTIYVTKDGVFDSATPAATTDQDGDGTLTLEFADCTEGMASYEITSLGISGEIPIERIVQDNVPLCETLLIP